MQEKVFIVKGTPEQIDHVKRMFSEKLGMVNHVKLVIRCKIVLFLKILLFVFACYRILEEAPRMDRAVIMVRICLVAPVWVVFPILMEEVHGLVDLVVRSHFNNHGLILRKDKINTSRCRSILLQVNNFCCHRN